MPRALEAELIIGQILLALGVKEMIGQFPFESLFTGWGKWPSFFVLIGLVVLVVWVAQLLVSLKAFFMEPSRKMPLNGIFHLWMYIPYSIMFFLACKYQSDYHKCLVTLIIIVILDAITSFIDLTLYPDKELKKLNKNWLKRDFLLFLPLLVTAWILHVTVDRKMGPGTASGILFFAGMIAGYILDMWLNPRFYGLPVRDRGQFSDSTIPIKQSMSQ